MNCFENKNIKNNKTLSYLGASLEWWEQHAWIWYFITLAQLGAAAMFPELNYTFVHAFWADILVPVTFSLAAPACKSFRKGLKRSSSQTVIIPDSPIDIRENVV